MERRVVLHLRSMGRVRSGTIKERTKAFYQKHLDHWKTIGDDFPVWTGSSAPDYTGHKDLLVAFYRLLPGPRILGAGCGPVARDLRFLARRGCHPVGVDLVPENVESARRVTTEGVTYRVADLTEPWPFPASSFHGVLCVAVVQHLTQPALNKVFLSQAARVLKPEGVFLLVFKKGKGVRRMFDRKLVVHRLFRLYEPADIVAMAQRYHLSPVPLGPGSKDSEINFEDGRGIPHSAILLCKSTHRRPGRRVRVSTLR